MDVMGSRDVVSPSLPKASRWVSVSIQRGVRLTWGQSYLLLISCVTLGKLLILSGLLFPRFKMGGNDANL